MSRPTALAALLLLAFAAPLGAQQLPSHCKRETVREERPLRGRAARDDSLRTAARRAVRDDLGARLRAAGVERPKGIVLFVTDARRREVSARVFGDALPDSVATAVGQRALPHLAALPGRGPAVLHVRLDSVPTPAPVVGSQSVTCTPHLANRLVVQQRLQSFASSTVNVVPHNARQRGAQIGMLLSRDGEVLHAEVIESSGDARMDRFAMDLAREMRFLPGSVDGVTQDVWVVLPIQVNMHPRPSTPSPRGRGPG